MPDKFKCRFLYVTDICFINAHACEPNGCKDYDDSIPHCPYCNKKIEVCLQHKTVICKNCDITVPFQEIIWVRE